jgi:hypothetical protein
MKTIRGGCHCGNVSFLLHWPESAAEIPVRECGCTFCQKHGAAWTSNRDAVFEIALASPALVSKYRFGTATAEFHVCSTCGVVPFVTNTIDERLYAVVNTNTFDDHAGFSLSRSASDFEGEEVADRLARRKRNWIANVTIFEGSP